MTDIVERLHQHCMPMPDSDTGRLMIEPADEIERLRASLEHTKDCINSENYIAAESTIKTALRKGVNGR